MFADRAVYTTSSSFFEFSDSLFHFRGLAHGIYPGEDPQYDAKGQK